MSGKPAANVSAVSALAQQLRTGAISKKELFEQLAALKKRRQFKKFSFRGIDLEKLLEMSNSPELVELLPSRIRRRFRRATIVVLIVRSALLGRRQDFNPCRFHFSF